MRILKRLLGWFYFIVLATTLSAICLCLLTFLILYIFSINLPDHTQLTHYSPNLVTRVFSNDGQLIAEYAVEKRVFLPIKFIPKKVINAFLAAEDKHFYSHFGVDPVGIARAVCTNLLHFGKKKRLVGASTITQQVAKLFFTGNALSYSRKVKEAILSFRLEKTLGKDKILELYLNQIYLGNGCYGIALAAKKYFGKAVEELSIAECSYLAALAKGANNYHPIKNKQKALARRNWVIERQLAAGFITEEQCKSAKHEDLSTQIMTQDKDTLQDNYFVEEVRRSLAKRFSYDELYKGGLIVHTTQDTELQKLAEKSLRHGLLSIDRKQAKYKGPLGNIEDGSKKLEDFPSSSVFKLAAVKSIDQDGTIRCIVKGEPEECLIKLSGISWIIQDEIKEKLPIGTVIKLSEVDKKSVKCSGIYYDKRTNTQKLLDGTDALKSLQSKSKSKLAYVIQNNFDRTVVRMPDGNSKLLSLDDLTELFLEDIKKIFHVGDVIYLTKEQDSYSVAQAPEIQGAILVVDPHNGNILALHGGFDFSTSEFDRTMQAKLQIGSLIKPFVYLAALNKGMCPSTVIDARYVAIDMGKLGIWEPKNYGMANFEDVTLRSALERSINTATVRVARYAGMDEISNIIKNFGILDSIPENISFVLGACESSAINIAKAYSIIANGGKLVEPHIIDVIQNKYGEVVFKNSYGVCNGCLSLDQSSDRPPIVLDDGKQVLDPAVVYQMQNMLEGVIQRGSGRRAKWIHYAIAGKTGTSNDNKVVWFVGFTPDILVVVLVARDDSKSLGEDASGSATALPIFIEFINEYISGRRARPFNVPMNVRIENFVDDRGDTINEILKENDDPTFLPEPDNVNFKEVEPDLYYAVRQFKRLYQ